MAADEVASKNHAKSLALGIAQEHINRDLKPHLDLITRAIRRALKLAKVAIDAKNETSDEILRAVVVLIHAYLEDFLRSLALVLLPIADEQVLDGVPLAGLGKSGRPEKFFLGKLGRHRGKSVDDVIKESVSEYLDRSTFNNVTEIMAFLDSVDVCLTDEEDPALSSVLPMTDLSEILPLLNDMMQRRHHIVHRADQAKTSNNLQPVDPVQVQSWLNATMSFMAIAARACFIRQHPLADLATELTTESEAKAKERKSGDEPE